MSDINKVKSQFDLKSIDAAKLAGALTEHQNSLIKLGLIVGSLIIAGLIFNDFRIKEQSVRIQMSQGQAKLDAIKEHVAAFQNLNDFKKSLPKKLNESELIALISNYASAHHVIISSLSPAESKDMGLYDVINISFHATSDNFKDMMLFLRKIEKSKFPLTVNSWSGQEVADGKMDFLIEISAVLIHP